MAADDLLVVGLDLDTGRHVHIEDRPIDQWRTLGYRHRESLVCAACFLGLDGVPAGTRVPLIPRGRIGGARRHHFAHPPHMAPPGGHHPETLWHLEAKAQLERWARSLPDVTEVRQEQWIPGRERRADVHVRLADGSRLALEAQSSLITDSLWQQRHRDYAAAGIRDIWFMRLGTALPHVLLAEQSAVCILDLADRQVRVLWGQPHPRTGRWWESEELSRYALHHPPCAGDDLHEETVPLAQLGLDSHGLMLSEDLEHKLAAEHQGIRHKAAEARRKAEQDNQRAHQLAAQAGHHHEASTPTPPSRPVRQPARPVRRAAPPRPRCAVCGGRLADVLARYGVHISIRTADGWVDCLDQPCAAPRPQLAPAAHTLAAPAPHAA
ncbi:competence protein CoiA family protein [Streptomyces tropicalis]|uniref:Competence protein CoiA family protein n=1 Tax=Streptomyces tropicalis TaxID=3034234 RepID=A0ABT6AE74_9ACTN|nr:competence protein CoiA family protein [Streptomyces tropicalis]MDF3302951.1 competence protein CoiA family protein [Streptomyces tropicalis]